jgi:hypothetical protein
MIKLFSILKNFSLFNYGNYVILGRWKIEKNLKSTFIKFDYANTDHCGTCYKN